jgi:hypothetical protein
MLNYKPRKVLSKIFKYLKTPDILVLHGARQVGKTTILKMLMEQIRATASPGTSVFYIDLEDFSLLELCNQGPQQVWSYLESKGASVSGKNFLFIDEIQYLDRPSSFLKLFHDHYSHCKLVVSGSSSFEIKTKFTDSLVGRILDFEIYNLDFEEYLDFKGQPFNLQNKNLPAQAHKELMEHFKDYLLYGGYPRLALEKDVAEKEIYLKAIINTYIKKDLRDVAEIRSLDKFNKLLRVLAGQAGNLLNLSEVSSVVGLARETLSHYLFLMENTYIIKLIYPYARNIRKEISRMPKLYFEDTGVLNILKNGTFQSQLDGFLFENGVYVYLRGLGGALHFWRTKIGQEIDFIREIKPDTFELFEAKLTYTSSASKHLMAFLADNHPAKAHVVCMNKSGKPLNDKRFSVVYPWEITETHDALFRQTVPR